MKRTQRFPLVDPLAAGVDVGSEKMFASVGGGAPAVFGTCTQDLHALRDWLKEQKVKAVAMEATGVYWLCLYGVLEAAGFEVRVVNGAHVKQVPGRKTDTADCQWLATLHAHGLLRGGFVPPAEIRRIRDYMRIREDLVSMGAAHVQHMHKALERLGIKIHTVISDITGLSGQAMVRAILAGERGPKKLVENCVLELEARKGPELLKALEGNWREEHLFALRLAVQAWDFYQGQIALCDGELKVLLEQLGQGKDRPELGPRKELRHNAPKDMPELQQWMAQSFGVDLTRLPAINAYTLMRLTAEVGCDMSPWPTVKHFTSWLGLAPGHRQSGKRRRRAYRPLGEGGRIFCLAAQSMANGKKSWLGSFYRRIRSVRGAKAALKATARKIAELFYMAITKGLAYVEQGIAKYEQRYRQQQARRLIRLLRELGIDPKLVADALQTPKAQT